MKIIDGTYYLTQGYGLTPYAKSASGKKAYKNFAGGIHAGLDFGTKGINLPILSTCTGKVVRASADGGWGNHVEVQGRDGWNRNYAHLSSISVKVGDNVVIGQTLGRVGTTGYSSGTHLHWGHRRRKLTGGWEYRDPSFELVVEVEKATMPTGKLIKGSTSDVYAFNGKEKFAIPTWGTLVFLFGDVKKEDIEIVSDDILLKIPSGDIIPRIA